MTRALLLALMLNVTTPLAPDVMVCAHDPPFPPHCNLWVVSTWPAHQAI